MKINEFLESKAFYRILALIIAVSLFSYANSNRMMSSNRSTTLLTSTRTQTISTNLKVNYNSDNYFVTGYPEKVKIRLTGSSALLTTLVNTGNFYVYADLNGLGVGTHTVKLKASGVANDINYKIMPETIKVTIAKKATKKMPITVNYDSSRIKSGYAASAASLSQNYVTLSGAQATLDKVASVVASVNVAAGTTSTINQKVTLSALDENGEALNVIFSTPAVQVTLPISKATATKQVSVNLVASGSGVEHKAYAFSTTQKTVTLTGTSSDLANISKVNVEVPITGVTTSTTKTVTITPPTGVVAISPAKITVKITTTDASSASSTSSTTSSKPTTSSAANTSSAAESTATSSATSTSTKTATTTATTSSDE